MNKKTIIFLLSQSVSIFGSLLVQYAISWYVALETGEGGSLAIVTICGFLPQAIITPFGGVLADRLNRKTLIQFADCTVAAATLCLALFMFYVSQNLMAIYVCSIIRSIGSGIQNPTYNAVVPQVVGRENLAKVNAVFTTIYAALSVVSPALAGIILKYSDFKYVLMIDVVTAVIGVSILSFIKIPPHEKALQKEKGGSFRDFKEGMAYSFKTPFIREYLIIFMLFYIGIVIPAFLNILLITRVFGDDTIYLTYNEIAYFGGSIIGGAILAKWGGFKNRVNSWTLGLLIFGVTTIGISVTPILWLYMTIMVICGLSMPLCNTIPTTLLQEQIKNENMLGRVFGIVNIIATVSTPLGMAVLGPMSDKVDIRLLTFISGFFLIILGLFTRYSKNLYKNGVKTDNEVAEKEQL